MIRKMFADCIRSSTAISLSSLLAISFVVVGEIQAVVVFQDNFESRAVGSLLPDAPPQIGSHYANGGTALDINTVPPGSVANGGNIFAQGPMDTDDHRMFISAANQSAMTNRPVNINFDFYLVGQLEGEPLRLVDFNTFTDAAYTGRGVSFQLRTDGTARYYDGSFHDVEGVFATNQWINVDIDADFGANTFTATAGELTFGGNMNEGTNFASLLFYIQLQGPGPATYFYDNIVISDDRVPTELSGDYNDNGVVDAADYAVWRDNDGTNNVLLNNSLPGPIGPAHYQQWKDHFGESNSGGLGAANVPEPTSSLWLVAGATCSLVVRSRIRRASKMSAAMACGA